MFSIIPVAYMSSVRRPWMKAAIEGIVFVGCCAVHFLPVLVRRAPQRRTAAPGCSWLQRNKKYCYWFDPEF